MNGALRNGASVLLALLGHGALLALALQQQPVLARLVDVTEVELMPPAPEPKPEPLPEPKPVPRAPAAQPLTQPSAAPRRARATPVPQPASAAPLHTVEEHVQTSEEPVRFVTDPNGSAFGYGTVARAGTGVAGVPGTPAAAPAAVPVGPRESPAPILSRAPSLAESEPCRGFFPTRAQVDRGEVALKVQIEAEGRVRAVTVSRESPSGHGFGAAARECLLSKHFSPALDVAGQPVAVVSPVTVRFSR